MATWKQKTQTKIGVYLPAGEVVRLDRIRLDMRQRTGRVVSRSGLIRSLLASAMKRGT